eukprot:TRINITY_DN11431_c0_g2_i1.p1 TRINITY_DN11431_c0_g2~~TRINITY_DN11431_c0_g2_i1.p1  ORF type:complete len:283 (+),score=23.63 TRINITY_DN11431_c0_g2_i1:137-985(+)
MSVGVADGSAQHQQAQEKGKSPKSMLTSCIFWAQFPLLRAAVTFCLMGIPTVQQFVLWGVMHWIFIGTCMTLGYHRYAAHHAFSTSRIGQFVVVFCTQLGWQGGALWWSSKHRRHHRYCDTSRDPHSWVQTSWLYAFLGWMFYETEVDLEFVPKHLDCPEIWLLNTFHGLPGACMLCLLYCCFGWEAMMWGYAVPSSTSMLDTLHFNVMFHPPDDENKCKAHDELGDKMVSWLFATMVGEARHEDHHLHPLRAKRPGGGDLPYWLVLAPLKAIGAIWKVHDE